MACSEIFLGEGRSGFSKKFCNFCGPFLRSINLIFRVLRKHYKNFILLDFFRPFLENFDRKKIVFFRRAFAPKKKFFGANGTFRKILRLFSQNCMSLSSTKNGIQRQVFEHVKILSERSQKRKVKSRSKRASLLTIQPYAVWLRNVLINIFSSEFKFS